MAVKNKDYIALEKLRELRNPITPSIVAYIDGSAYWKSKLGGVGVYLKYHPKTGEVVEKRISKGYFNTTNNRMELRALLLALKSIKIKNLPTFVCTDSEYVVKCFNYFRVWISSGDLTSIPNSDILIEIDREASKFSNLDLFWIRGHFNIEGNEIADSLANYKQFKPEQRVKDLCFI